MPETIDYTRRSYERRADSYDSDRLANDAQRLWYTHDIEVLDELLPRHARILEVACGTGRMTIPLAATPRTLVGLELAGSMLRQAVNKAPAEAWLQGNAAQLPFRDNSFDALYGVRFLNLFSVAQLPTLCAELTRVVRPGGVLVLQISNAMYGGVISILRRRRGTYSKHLLWPWQIGGLFPNCRVERSIGTYLPWESPVLLRLHERRATRVRHFIAKSPFRYVTHTRYVQLVKVR